MKVLADLNTLVYLNVVRQFVILMRYIFFYSVLILLISCSTIDSDKEVYSKPLPKIDTMATFVDSTNIASCSSNKIYLARVVIDDTISKVLVRFYSKKGNEWQLKYAFEEEQWSGNELMQEITDFNNDGYKDVTYLTGTGARGGNLIMNLFIYDKRGDSLIYVTNSNEYPNLYYNKETNSINSYILTGGNETVFMRLNNNKLQPFASVYQDDYVTVSVYDSTGQSKVLYIDSMNKYDFFARFTNYKPLKVEE